MMVPYCFLASSHHEAGEDHSKRGGGRGRRQDGGPQENEDVHAALDDALWPWMEMDWVKAYLHVRFQAVILH